jgi:hypothetical protein
MHRVTALGLCVLLCGCGASSTIIRSNAVEFNDIVEDTTNKLLVVNVLRARDKAPLHFADIPLMRETIQQSGSLGAQAYVGAIRPTFALRDILTAGGNMQVTPSFDMNPLYSKEFAQGMASTIDPKIVKYWLDRGLDRRIVLLLFFSAAEIVETRAEGGPINTIRIANSPRDAIDAIKSRRNAPAGPEELRCDTQSDFERYLKLLNSLKTFFAHSYKERRLLASGLNLDAEKDTRNLQGLAALDQSKVQLVYDRGRSAHSLYALSNEQKIAFCFYDENQPGGSSSSRFESIAAGATSAGEKTSCFQSVVEIPAEDSTKKQISESPIFHAGPAPVKSASPYCSIYNKFTGASPVQTTGDYPKLELRLHIRSVGEIFQFLGDLLQYQDDIKDYLEANRQLNLKLNTPVTFGFCGDNPTPGCDNVFFRLDEEACNARFTLTYRDRQYAVANFIPPGAAAGANSACRPGHAERKDYTLEVLSVLHQLIGLNKSATDVRTTPFVNVLP